QAREFIGRAALEEHRALQAAGELPGLVGLVLEGRGVLREGQKVVASSDDNTAGENTAGEGVVTSGSFSPTLNQSIALARVPVGIATGSGRCQVQIRRDLV